MKNLSTQEILELLRTLEHRGVSREEVLKALLSDVEKHKEIGEFLVLRAQDGEPKSMFPSSQDSYSYHAKVGGRIRNVHYNYKEKVWKNGIGRRVNVKNWYDFGDEE